MRWDRLGWATFGAVAGFLACASLLAPLVAKVEAPKPEVYKSSCSAVGPVLIMAGANAAPMGGIIIQDTKYLEPQYQLCDDGSLRWTTAEKGVMHRRK